LWVNTTQAPSELHNQIYPAEFSSLGIVGNLWGGNAVFQTFFSYGSCEYLHHFTVKNNFDQQLDG
jgi:hypothetical protein